jgi:N-acetylglucosaminyl-diphospho-decaprenol L-rhamnosyltransferase
VLLLNPDSLVLEGSLDTLVAFMDEHPDVGICGPKVRFPDGRIQLSCRRFPTWRSALARRTPLRSFMQRSRLNTDHLMADVDHDRVQEVDWMIGACLLARRAAIDQVGLLDEGFFLYVEDIDWCYRMWQGGWRVVYVPTAQVVHHLQAVSERRWLTRRTLIHYSSIARFLWKHRLRPVLAPLLRMT